MDTLHKVPLAAGSQAAGGAVDFFKSQDMARRRTSILVWYYCLAVVCIILAVYVTATMLFTGAMVKTGHKMTAGMLWNPDLFVYIAGGTCLIVLAGTMFKISQLSSGGAKVAEMLGGRELQTNTRDLNERKVLNVVEEMAIASGLPVPRVFVMDGEEGINAFAAGFTPGDAVVGVTRGCIDQLNRDELQGVIGHEFSHVLNGDMKLNIRLMGVLNGILLIGLVGYWIFRSTANARSKKGNNLPFVVFGLIVWAVGYIGVFFGKLIKSAVSRQREYLADASAVQFTRNPAGLAGALKKIGGYAGGSRLTNDHAEEASHLFFCNGLGTSFIQLMATHPPLEERIARLDPSFVAGALQAGAGGVRVPPPLPEEADGAVAGVSRFAVKSANVVASVGTTTSQHVRYAADLIAGMPGEVVSAVREAAGARAVIYALLLSSEDRYRSIQLKTLSADTNANLFSQTVQLAPILDMLGQESKLPLVDMAIPALKQLTPEQYAAFRKDVDSLVAADQQVDLFEYTLHRILMRHLESAYTRVKSPAVIYSDVPSIAAVCGRLLSCLAYWGADDAGAAQQAFAKGTEPLGAGVTVKMSGADECGLPLLDEALGQVALAAPMVKKTILDACVSCIAADGYVTIEEAELIRAVADSMDCPLPPFLPGTL